MKLGKHLVGFLGDLRTAKFHSEIHKLTFRWSTLKLFFTKKNAGLKKNMKARAEDLTHKCFTDF